MEVKGTFSRPITNIRSENTYACHLYKANPQAAVTPSGEEKVYFKAVGNNLPTAHGVTYMFTGRWKYQEKRKENVFEVDHYEIDLSGGKNGIIQYLQSIDGIGPALAEKLYNVYGSNLLEILDQDIDQIRDLKGIGERTFNKVRRSWFRTRKAKELFTFLLPFEIPQSSIMKIYEKYEAFALSAIKNNPYLITDVNGVGFNTADKIAMSLGFDFHDECRIEGGILEVIREYEFGGRLLKQFNRAFKTDYQGGNTCIEWPLLFALTRFLLRIELSDYEMSRILEKMMNRSIKFVMIKKEDASKEYFFRMDTYRREVGISKSLKRLLSNSSKLSLNLTPSDVSAMNDELISVGNLPGPLSEEQCKAVCTCLNNQLSILTGGPGTGKTMIQKAILYILQKHIKDAKVILAAPTGKAAYKMSEATGYPARTLHSLLQYNEETIFTPIEIDADLILIDEFSMIDTTLANVLFATVTSRTRVLCIGDDNQLPSIGPGAVLREMIASRVIPTAVLTNVFRQAKGASCISYNASRIKSGEATMHLDDSFEFIECATSEGITEVVKDKYVQLVAEYGLEDVCVLSPFRVDTSTGVNALNTTLQSIFQGKNKQSLFLKGDKVIYTKNEEDLTNGDIGIVIDCKQSRNEKSVIVDFGHEKIVDIRNERIKNLELAYSTTIHKSQGSEYAAVMLIIDPSHHIMHRRNLIYTAITRAKKKLIIVGNKETFRKGVLKEDTLVRESCLSLFLRR